MLTSCSVLFFQNTDAKVLRDSSLCCSMQFFTSQAHFSQGLYIDICKIGLYRAVTLNKGIDFCDFGPNSSSTLYSFTMATHNQTVQD